MNSPQIITVRSSAGAGKTYNLAQHYLRLLVMDQMTGNRTRNHISNIIAITFTNKAAAEMRSRIIDWMKRIILDLPFQNSSMKTIDEILIITEGGRGEAGGERAGREIQKNNTRDIITNNFEDILKNFYDFNVSTIDSFVNLILTASAFKLNLPPDFDISIDSAPLIDLVIQECFQALPEKTNIRGIFDRFIESYIDMEGENVNWTARGFFRNTVNDLWREESKENKEFLYRDTGSALTDIGKKVHETAQFLKQSLEAHHGISLRADFQKALASPIDLRKNVLSDSKCFTRQSLSESILKGSKPPDDMQEQLWQDLLHARRLFVETLSEGKYSPYVEAYGLFKTMLLKEVTFRKRIILIEQLNKLLQGIVREKHFVPEIYYALSERYAHFLIDEFQDTNQLQWQNIETLAEEALGRGGTLFLVGDKKQAIYRWRGGNAELIDEVSSRYQAYGVHELTLRNNYRSGEHIITFNNRLFQGENLAYLIDTILDKHPEPYKKKILDTYRESNQAAIDTAHGRGYVKIEKIVDGEGEGAEKDRFLKDERDAIIAEKIARLMAEIKGRGIFQDKDIAILVRRRKEAELVVRTLLEVGIGVESEFTVNIKNNQVIRELLGLMRFFNAPDDDLSFAEFITGSIFRNKTALPEQAIYEWLADTRAGDRDKHLYKSFQRDYRDTWEEYFEYFFKITGYLPLYDFFILLVKKWGVLRHFKEDVTYVLHLCEIIKGQEGSDYNNLSGFMELCTRVSNASYDETSETEKQFLLNTTGGANAVKVMTVHKAKGLQFPVVILPFLKLTTFGNSDSRDKNKAIVSEGKDLKLFYIKKNYREISETLRDIYRRKETEFLLDELNNTYVACTRAERELYIFLADSVRQKNFLIDYIFTMDNLKEYIGGNIVEIGERYASPVKTAGPVAPGAQPQELNLDDMDDRIRWMEIFKKKFTEPDTVTRRNIIAQDKGDLIHYILSLICTLPQDHSSYVREAIRAGMAKLNTAFDASTIEEIIFRLFRDPRIRSFFQPEEDAIVFTEKEIIDRGGSSFKIDRLIIYPSRIDVVDFKTGETRSEEHVEQINNYGRLLRLMYPGKEINKYLLYVDDNSLIEV